MFSIFEQYTEWITKGKQHKSVELGKKLSLTTDQNNLIVDYHIREHQADSQIVIDIAVDLRMAIFTARYLHSLHAKA